MQIFSLLSAAFLAAAPGGADLCDTAAEAKVLAAAHKQILRAHLENDPAAWLALEADKVVLGREGLVYTEDYDFRKERGTEYLSQSKFTMYDDMVEPVTEVADDCSIGWVIAQVRVKGEFGEGDAMQPVNWQSSWIELYRKIDGAWRIVGSVSNYVEKTD